MLFLPINTKNSIYIGKDIQVLLYAIREDGATLGINAPRSLVINRYKPMDFGVDNMELDMDESELDILISYIGKTLHFLNKNNFPRLYELDNIYKMLIRKKDGITATRLLDTF